MKYNNEQSRGSPGGSPGGSLEVRALTYNLSWASQKKAIAGSEADFVERCEAKNRDCYKKALIKIQKLHYAYNFDVIGIQEVEDPDLVTSICDRTGLDGWYRGATWHCEEKIYSGCAIMWNTRILGTMVTGKTINLARIDKDNKCDARTCCIVTTSKDINLIVAHFPWLETRDHVISVADIINAHITSNGPIIILADTNDSKTFITKETPLIIKNKSLSHGLSKSEANKDIKSCCWHKKDHKYKHFIDTGDYILSENVALIERAISNYPSNDDDETELYSDHMPIAGTIILHSRKSRTRAKSEPFNRKSKTRKSKSRGRSASF